MRKIIKKLHLYLALILCLPLVIQGLTGAVLVFQHEISNYFDHKNHVFLDGKKHKFSEITLAAKSQVPEGFKVSLIKFEDESAIVRFSKKTEEKNQTLEVIIDPVSLEILKIKNSENDLLRLIKKFHASLLIKGEIGKNIVGIYGFVMLFMTISGIILWWPKSGKWNRAFSFKFSAEGKKFHRDMHAAIGFWLSIFLFILSFSGIYLIYPKGTTTFINSIFSGQDLRESANAIKVEPQEKFVEIDDLAALASSEGDVLSVIFSAKQTQPYRFNIATKNYRQGQPPIVLFIDQYRGKIIEKRDPKNYSVGETISVWQHSLHEGQGFGIIFQILVFLQGFSILLFSITGVAMWLYKKKILKA